MLREIPVQFYTNQNGETIAFRQIGNGKQTLLLIHGNMSSSIHFDTLMEHLEDEYTIYAPDLRGFGDSTYHNRIESLQDFAKDVQSFITAFNLSDVVVAGWSTGGGIALELAALCPELIKKVILIEAVGIKGYPMYRKDESGKPILTELIHDYDDIKNDPIQVIPALVAHETKNKEFFQYIYNLLIYNKKKPEEERYERYLDAILKQRNLVDVDYALVHFNMTNEHNGVCYGNNRVALIKSPVLIIQGENDLVIPVMFGQETKKHIGDLAEIILLKDSGHSPLTDNFEKLVEIIRDFISK